MQLREWNARLHGLVVFRALLGDPVVAKLAALTDRLEAADDTIAPLCDAVAAFEAALFAHTTNLGDYLSNAVLETETVCVRQAAAGQLSPVMEAALNSELNFLQKLCGLTLDALLEAADRQNRELAFLPRWEARQLDLTAAYNQRMREAGKKGYGMFAKHHVFTVETGQLVPVKYPDPQKLSELPGYEKEREKVIANTKALLAAIPEPDIDKRGSLQVLKGEVSSPINPAPGCRFAHRCPYARPECMGKDLTMQEITPGHYVACPHCQELNG